MDADAEKVMEVIEEFAGVLPFTDKASPEVIMRETGLSKNAFKRAVGRLYKERRIEITEYNPQIIVADIFMYCYDRRNRQTIRKKEYSMKNVISTDKAAAAIGPYSQAIEVNGMVYTAGIVPVVPASRRDPGGSGMTKQALTNLSHRPGRQTPGMADMVKTTVFVEMNDFNH